MGCLLPKGERFQTKFPINGTNAGAFYHSQRMAAYNLVGERRVITVSNLCESQA